MRDGGLTRRGQDDGGIHFDYVPDRDADRKHYIVDLETGGVYTQNGAGLEPVDDFLDVPDGLHDEIQETYGVSLSIPDDTFPEPYGS